MNNLYSITTEDYLEIIDRATKAGVKPGESIEKYFLEYIKEKGIHSFGATELNLKELKQEYQSHGKTVTTIHDFEKEEND